MSSKSIPSDKSGTSFSMDDFAKALEQYDYRCEKGQVVKGKAFEYDSDGAYVDIGGKSPGYISTREAGLGYGEISELLPLGEEFEFSIVQEQNAEGQVTLSRRQLQLKQAWADVSELSESGKSTQMRVTGVNKGGVTGEVEGLRAFIPRSHLEDRDNMDSLVGELLTATFLEVDPENKKLVLSQRGAIQARAIASLKEQTLVSGKVASIKAYGIFVDLRGVSGLLHVSQVSANPIESLSSVFKVGQEIKVVISEIDEYKNRLSLTMKVLEEYPGEILEKMSEVMATAEERWQKAQQSTSD
jgi:small subunit ribosomal protein S1